jgi:hypothetical protein
MLGTMRIPWPLNISLHECLGGENVMILNIFYCVFSTSFEAPEEDEPHTING